MNAGRFTAWGVTPINIAAAVCACIVVAVYGFRIGTIWYASFVLLSAAARAVQTLRSNR